MHGKAPRNPLGSIPPKPPSLRAMRPPSPSSIDMNYIIDGSLATSEKPCDGTAPLLATSMNTRSRLQAPVAVEVEEAEPAFALHTIFPNSSPAEPRWCDITSVPKSRKCALGAPAQPPRPVSRVARRPACITRRPRRAHAVTCISTPFSSLSLSRGRLCRTCAVE